MMRVPPRNHGSEFDANHLPRHRQRLADPAHRLRMPAMRVGAARHGRRPPGRPAPRAAPQMFTPRVARVGESFSAAGVEVTLFDTHHFDEFSTAGVLAAAGARRLAYAPDFKRTEADLAGLDLLALDASMLSGESFGHI